MKERFKTKAEFIEEFGDNWRTDVFYGWPEQMDYMLGTPVSDYVVTHKSDHPMSKYLIGGLYISPPMLTHKPLPENGLTPKTVSLLKQMLNEICTDSKQGKNSWLSSGTTGQRE